MPSLPPSEHGQLDFAPNLGTIEPNMGTNARQDALSAALFGRTRQAVLARDSNEICFIGCEHTMLI